MKCIIKLSHYWLVLRYDVNFVLYVSLYHPVKHICQVRIRDLVWISYNSSKLPHYSNCSSDPCEMISQSMLFPLQTLSNHILSSARWFSVHFRVWDGDSAARWEALRLGQRCCCEREKTNWNWMRFGWIENSFVSKSVVYMEGFRRKNIHVLVRLIHIVCFTVVYQFLSCWQREPNMTLKCTPGWRRIHTCRGSDRTGLANTPSQIDTSWRAAKPQGKSA